MPEIQDETFGEIILEQKPINEDGTVSFKRRDDGPYAGVIDKLIAAPPGTEAKVTVVTGAIRVNVKQHKDRGQQELAEAKAFQEAANNAGWGLRVSARHRTDGQTTLRMMLVPKREFTPQQERNRLLGQYRARLGKYQNQLGALQLAVHKDPADADAAAALKEMEGKIADLQAKLNGDEPAAPAPSKPAAKTSK